MPRTVTITFDDGGQHVYNNVPDDVTPDAIEQRAASEFSGKKLTGIDGGRGSRASTIPDVPPQPTRAPEPSFMDKVKGAGEAALTLATGATGGLVGTIGGALGTVAGSIRSGDVGTPEGNMRAQEVVPESAQRFTYAPRTETGQEYVRALAPALSNLAALPPAMGLSSLVGPSMAQVRQAAPAMVRAAVPTTEMNALRAPFVKEEPQMPGMGAAMTNIETLRNERAQSLPVPIDLTKGQLSRTFEQQRFERETAKIPKAGEPLRQRFADQNERILQNFDAWAEETGAQAPDLRATGQIVNQVVVEKAKKAKSAIDAAYTKARASGEMNEPVDVAPLLDYARRKSAASNNAGVITSLEQAVNDIAGPQRKDIFGQPIPRTVSVNDLEEIRQMVGTAGQKDAPNGHYAREIKGIIDGLTEGKGGEEYKRARYLRTRYAKEFENIGVVDKLMSTKPGSTDRAVAYEDVFNHSILSGSLDDVRSVRKTLQTAGPGGEQAWKELQGQTVSYIKDAASKNAQKDIRGNPIVSFAGLDKAVRNLDQDGKLDFVFGQQGAQKIRDIRDIAADVVTSPPGSINTSNTASVVMAALDAVGMFHGIPAPVATITHQAVKAVQNRKLNTQVSAALNPYPMPAPEPSGLASLIRR